MPSRTATRTPEPASSAGQQALVPLSPAAIVTSARTVIAEFTALSETRKGLTALAGRLRRWADKATALPTVEGPGTEPIAVVIQDRAQERAVVEQFKEYKAIQKALAQHFKAVEKATRAWNTEKKAVKDLADPLGGLLNAGIVLFRDRIEQEVADAARKQAEADEAARVAEERRLRAAAKTQRGTAKRDTLSDARAVAADRVDPGLAAQEARDRTQQSFRGAGRAPTKKYYSARMDSLKELVCAVVASDSALRHRVRELVPLMRTGECDTVGIAALTANMQELNRRVGGDKKGLRIPGVSVVSRSSVANL